MFTWFQFVRHFMCFLSYISELLCLNVRLYLYQNFRAVWKSLQSLVNAQTLDLSSRRLGNVSIFFFSSKTLSYFRQRTTKVFMETQELMQPTPNGLHNRTIVPHFFSELKHFFYVLKILGCQDLHNIPNNCVKVYTIYTALKGKIGRVDSKVRRLLEFNMLVVRMGRHHS